MATRGRTNTASSKKTTSVKKAPISKTKAKASGKTSVLSQLAGAGSSLLGLTGAKRSGQNFGIHHKSAKQKLKKAYERKAKRQISMGMLGQARRTLRKKATVV
jgi:hypothetical protein